MKRIMIIDGNSLIYRAFYALPIMQNIDGEYTNALYGFSKILIKLINENNPKYMVVAFDLSGPTFRHKIYNEYKGTRKKMPDELRPQLDSVKKMLRSMNIKVVEKPGLEADDLIGMISKKYNNESVIITGDKDAYQLIDDKTIVWHTKKGISDLKILDLNSFKKEYGITPKEFIDVKALMGDASDNIPGIMGVGEKTALKLIKKYGSIDCMYENIEDFNGRLKEKLSEGRECAYLSKKLARIEIDDQLDLDKNDFLVDDPFNRNAFDFFIRYGLKSIAKNTSIFDGEFYKGLEKKVELINISTNAELDNLIDQIEKKTLFSFYYSATNIHIAYSYDKEYLINIRSGMLDGGLDYTEVLTRLDKLLSSKKISKVLFDSKNDMHLLDKEGININNIKFDIILAEFLINSQNKYSKDIETFTNKYSYNKEAIASCMLFSKSILNKKISELDMKYLYYDLELKLIEILYDMEKTGFNIDIKVLDVINKDLIKEINNLTKKIHELAGVDFNIKSPKQLGEILFDKLKLSTPNKKKLSTSVEVLELLKTKHPIIEPILKYRHLTKLNSTYIEPYKKLTNNDDSLVHTRFSQTTTVTGRLSSNEPNLQNIPIRTDTGKKIRKMFISRFEKGEITSADYSQIELRLMAHLSKDEGLTSAYKNNLDIHTQTASDIFEVPIKDVTDNQRRNAKAVNFGIIYGISTYGLSKSINSSIYEAKIYMDKYFTIYKGVRQFMKKCVEDATANGYVKTIYNRRRYFRNIHTANKNIREFEERAAMNMPLQGSASDIIKIAMINVSDKIKEMNLKSKLILQVHDELIIDTHPDEIDVVKKILKKEMEERVNLDVPLVSDISSGKSWFDAH